MNEEKCDICRKDCGSNIFSDKYWKCVATVTKDHYKHVLKCFTETAIKDIVTSSSDRWKEFFLDRAELKLVFDVRTEAGNPLYFTFDAVKTKELNIGSNFSISSDTHAVDPKEDFGLATLMNSLDVVAVNLLFAKTIENLLIDKATPKIQSLLNEIFTGVTLTPEPGLVIDSTGISIRKGLFFEKDIPDLAEINCFEKPEIPSTFQNNEIFQLKDDEKVGFGISLFVFESLFNQLANAGYFCYNGTSGNTLIRVTPSGGSEINYAGNNLFKVIFPMRVKVNTLTDETKEDGKITFLYRIIYDFTEGSLNLKFIGISDDFTKPEIKTALGKYKDNINLLIQENPELFNISAPDMNPMSYIGFQPSMFRQIGIDKRSENLLFTFDASGMILDYSGKGQKNEWVWFKDTYSGKSTKFFLNGLLEERGGEYSADSIQLKDYQHIPMFIFNEYQGKNIRLTGDYDWQKKPWETASPDGEDKTDIIKKWFADDSDKILFYPLNLFNDLFYIDAGGKHLAKQYWPAQNIEDFDKTTGVYALNIHGDSTPEIMQILDKDDGSKIIKWHIANYLNDAGNGIVYEGEFPEDIKNETIYQFKVIDKSGGVYDKFQINNEKYKAKVDAVTKTVKLIPVPATGDLNIVNGSFEQVTVWNDKTAANRSLGWAADGAYSLMLGRTEMYPLPNDWRQFNESVYISQRHTAREIVIKPEEHEIGGSYILSYYVSVMPVSNDTFSIQCGTHRECKRECINYVVGKYCWKTCKTVADYKTYNFSINNAVKATARFAKEGSSVDPEMAGPGFLVEQVVDNQPNIPINGVTWQKYEATFSAPEDAYIGMDFVISLKTDRAIWLDNVTLKRTVPVIQ